MHINKLILIIHFLKKITKKSLAFEHYKKCLFNNQTVKWIQYRIKRTPRSVNTVKITKIALKNTDGKRLCAFNGITTYPHGTNPLIMCLEELKVKHAFARYPKDQKIIIA